MKENRNIVIIGLGYVGLTLAVRLAVETEVVGIENNHKVLDSISKGKAHFYEKDMDDFLQSSLKSGNLSLLGNISHFDANGKKSSFIITIGTPYAEVNNLHSLFGNLLEELNEKIKDGDIIVLRSTVSVGTSEFVKNWFKVRDKDIDVCFCPERTVEGRALYELSELPQIISSTSERGLTICKEIFGFIGAETVVASNLKTAELAKLTSNIERDVYFGFANQMNFIAKHHGVSFGELRNIVTYNYSRSFLKHTAPVGGPCLEKDTYILKQTTTAVPHLTSIIDAARAFNESWPEHIVAFLKEKVNLAEYDSICLTGLSFKGTPLTDDLRGTMALELFNRLRSLGIPLSLYDRHVNSNSIRSYFNVSSTEVLASADFLKDQNVLILVQNGSDFAIDELDNLGLSYLDLTSFHYGKKDSTKIL